MAKPKVVFYWCASCGGCEEAVVDLAERILVVVEAVDIVLWPVALDFKKSDVEAMADGEMAVCFINGAVRTSEQEEMVELCRQKAGLVVAFGSCAHTGGIPGLANLKGKEETLRRAYVEAESNDNPNKVYPETVTKVPEGHGTVTLPAFRNTVKCLDQCIDVDYYLPGCAPPPDLIFGAVLAILEGKLPPKGTVLAPDIALCDECERQETKPEKVTVEKFFRPWQKVANETDCLLAQGFLCMGPSTRSGCGAPCVKGNWPCTGCLGPTSRVKDHGAKALSGFASVFDCDDEAEVAKLLDQIADPAGTFYRYSVPSSLLHRALK
jgi:F420-non-reducing hydrogenase small subunit